jgi:hypothetical protein
MEETSMADKQQLRGIQQDPIRDVLQCLFEEVDTIYITDGVLKKMKREHSWVGTPEGDGLRYDFNKRERGTNASFCFTVETGRKWHCVSGLEHLSELGLMEYRKALSHERKKRTAYVTLRETWIF